MDILSPVPNGSPDAPPQMDQTMAFQDLEHLGEPMFSSEQFLATSRTRYKVARHSLLSSSPPDPCTKRKRRLSMGVEADPIFQVFEEIENKPNRRFRSFLQVTSTKAREDDSSSGQEENKPSKSMFKILKKGLSTPQNKKESFEEVSPEDQCDNTTISSITRSVTSNHAQQKVPESKQNMPLGVLNGIFKAAKKLQNKKKRKAKSHRMRSLSKDPPKVPMKEVEAGKLFFAKESPSTPHIVHDTRGEIGVAEERECGTYGNLIPANVPKRTPRLGDAPTTPAIYSVASW